jgi:phenylalanyl-tRNA synthetase beta chain
MHVPLSWLKEFIDIEISADEVAQKLTLAGLEVEAIDYLDDDYVFEVNVTPNRGDCLSILGIARELSAITGIPLKIPEHEIKAEEDYDFKIEIKDKELCNRYTGRVVKGVTIADSPDWIKTRLEKCGIRAINNIVDITNYVLLELGHPLHAFDLDTLMGNTIRVDVAGENQSIVTLDGVERKLPESALLIWDAERPVAVAGVMGGAETEVTESTKNIFLESAYFKPTSIRRTSKALGLKSESSYRFERGTDIEMLETALDRTAFLIEKIAGGKIGKKIDAYPKKFVPEPVTVRYEKVNRLLGTDIPHEDMLNTLKKLNLDIKTEKDYFIVTPPSSRSDLKRDADIIEEIARLYGYDRIPTTVPKADITSAGKKTWRHILSDIKNAMLKEGFHEAVNYSFMNEKYLDILNIPEDDRRRKTIRLKNPLRKEDSLLRTMILPSLVENFIYNFFRGIKDIRIFETSKVFENTGEALPLESLRLGGIYFKEKTPSLWKETAEDFYLVKGALESLFEKLKIKECSFSPSGEPFLHPGKSADIYIAGERTGFMGALSPEVVERLDVKTKSDILVFELDVDKLLSFIPESLTYTPIPKFPPIERDVALVIDDSIKASEIINLIRAYPTEFIEEVSVFDFYKGSNIPEGKKSLAFSIRYRSKERTLTDEEVETLHKGLIEYLTAKTGGKIRGQ